MELLNGGGFWDTIGSLFDIIPKIIYYLYAALASGVDALQSLVRKLAGLDTYYSRTSGSSYNTIRGQDPLSEFVYGILGVGDSASVYKALNTVFWSLAIFGLIMLVVSTMIAIIKSHYNEDTAGTSPWKYIYTAIKAILTFAVIPVVVVLGMSLSTFALSTLDKIVAGYADTGAIYEIYGGAGVDYLEKDTSPENEGGTGTYSHYDFFGAQSFTTSTPFSGMLFKASAYNANRARADDSTAYKNTIRDLDKSIFTTIVGEEGDNYLADSIDYAFANCLMYKKDERPAYSDWKDTLKGQVTVGLLDIWRPGKINGFTKWNVSTVWLFYDLWQFNFIVGFTGVTASFGILMSIVFGLMTRLIKGAALFLIFPALLGIAPMDNFKAFKSWGTQFMQQILMVFGAILGMNLLLLILPYIQNISFFDPEKLGILNAIMDVVILVVGLQMAKDFINIVNGFVGGADAVGAGDVAKAGTKDAIMKGAKTAIGAGKVGAFAMASGAAAIRTVGGKVIRSKVGDGVKSDLNSANSDVAAREKTLTSERKNKSDAEAKLSSAKSDIATYAQAMNARDDIGGGNGEEKQKRAIAKYREAHIGDAEVFNLSDDEIVERASYDYQNTVDAMKYKFEDAKKVVAKDSDVRKTIKSSKTKIDKLEGDGAGSIYEAKNEQSAAIKRANFYGFNVEDGVIKERQKKTTYKTQKDEFGHELKDAKGNPIYERDEKGKKIVEKQGSGFSGAWSKFADFTGPLAKNLGSELLKNTTTWGGIGKNIADGFAKSFSAGAGTFGLDKLTKDLKDVAGQLKQTTFKAPDKTGLAGLEGDKLTKEVADKQKSRDEAMLKVLEEISKNTKPKNSGTSTSK